MKAVNLAGFVSVLRTLPSAVKRAEKHGLEVGAKLIEAEAKAELGVYQSDTGPFPAWETLADRTQAERVQQGYSANEPGLRSGAARASISHTVEGSVALIGSDDQHLVWFERGTSRQPPRSVFGVAGFRKGEEAAKAIGKAVQHAIAGEKLP